MPLQDVTRLASDIYLNGQPTPRTRPLTIVLVLDSDFDLSVSLLSDTRGYPKSNPAIFIYPLVHYFVCQ